VLVRHQDRGTSVVRNDLDRIGRPTERVSAGFRVSIPLPVVHPVRESRGVEERHPVNRHILPACDRRIAVAAGGTCPGDAPEAVVVEVGSRPERWVSHLHVIELIRVRSGLGVQKLRVLCVRHFVGADVEAVRDGSAGLVGEDAAAIDGSAQIRRCFPGLPIGVHAIVTAEAVDAISSDSTVPSRAHE
jgi:hypothetical protein